MAGLGYKDFTAGAVLTAAQVDGYLMEQAVMNFAGTAARGSALSSVQSAGMMAHVGGGTVTVYDGSAWQQVYPNSQGLVHITTASCGTAATVSINNCFSSTYNIYLLTIERPSKTLSADNFRARLRLSGTDATTNYNHQFFQANGATLTGGQLTAQTSTRIASIAADGESTVLMHVINPAIATTTIFISKTMYAPSNAPTILDYNANHTTATAYDGITLFPETGAFSGGTIRVYGYRNS